MLCLALSGSSPLTRGKPFSFRSLPSSYRLIPAHAGKTRDTRARHAVPTAHPRSRGENFVADYAALKGWGSSPLTRGKQGINCQGHRPHRLIPAHAGKTSPHASRSRAMRAHPRSRGENFVADYAALKEWGSSPLTRGKHNFARARVIRERLIPAHAGKTKAALHVIYAPRAHPRSRGENCVGCAA